MSHSLGEGPTGLPRSEHLHTPLFSSCNLVPVKVLGSGQVSSSVHISKVGYPEA